MQRKKGSYCYLSEILHLVLVLLFGTSQLAASGTVVNYLPGFEGPLPFHLETGYLGVGESEDEQIFYYFLKSENNPKEDPLVLWITGGPSCSSFSGLFYEIGPIAFKFEEYKGGVPRLELRSQSWTKVSSIIFADLPAPHVGFSYSKSPGSRPSDHALITQADQFLRKWLVEHPEYLSNEVYIGGDSYSGITVPAVFQEMSNGNEKGIQPLINLQGYMEGNPITTEREYEYLGSFSYGMGIISEELYMSFKRNCEGGSPTASCEEYLYSIIDILNGSNDFHILEPKCESDSKVALRRLLSDEFDQLFDPKLSLPPLSCRSYVYFLCRYWANIDEIRTALHVRKDSIGEWIRCNKDIYIKEIPSSFEYHANLSKKGYRSLIYSGDHDPIVPFSSTQAWIRALNYSIVDDWRPWFVKDQVAGYTRTYANQMTFATVKGAGHIAPEYKPEECFAMFRRWISRKPL